MKLFSKIALATATISMASVASAASVSGYTDFRVTLPEILVLYHWDDAHLILENANSVVADPTAHTETQTLAASHELNTDESKDVLTSSTTKFDDGTVAVTLKNAWAVRSLSSGTVNLVLTNPNATLYSAALGGTTQTNTSTIAIGSPTLSAANTSSVDGSATGTELKIKSGWDPVKGDIDFTLNLTNANHAGEYNTRGASGPAAAATTDTFLLTLNGN